MARIFQAKLRWNKIIFKTPHSTTLEEIITCKQDFLKAKVDDICLLKAIYNPLVTNSYHRSSIIYLRVFFLYKDMPSSSTGRLTDQIRSHIRNNCSTILFSYSKPLVITQQLG